MQQLQWKSRTVEKLAVSTVETVFKRLYDRFGNKGVNLNFAVQKGETGYFVTFVLSEVYKAIYIKIYCSILPRKQSTTSYILRNYKSVYIPVYVRVGAIQSQKISTLCSTYNNINE